MKARSLVTIAAIVAGVVASLPNDARGFTHVVRKGESLASIASAVYGRPDWEHILVGANASGKSTFPA